MLTVQVGQCGNQLGTEIFCSVADELKKPRPLATPSFDEFYRRSVESFFRVDYDHDTRSRRIGTGNDGRLIARSILVDTEPRVVAGCFAAAERKGTFKFDHRNAVTRESGSANNWAHGYCLHGHTLREEVVELARREIELCDYFGGFHILMSVAGGTGSGVGTFLTETLRDIFPSPRILNSVVWPYDNGEVIVQNYNALLTLSNVRFI